MDAVAQTAKVDKSTRLNMSLTKIFFVHTIIMDIEFDHCKDAINIAKHDVSLSLAKDLEWSNL